MLHHAARTPPPCSRQSSLLHAAATKEVCCVCVRKCLLSNKSLSFTHIIPFFLSSLFLKVSGKVVIRKGQAQQTPTLLRAQCFSGHLWRGCACHELHSSDSSRSG